jgi:hypothetical protein
MNLDSINEAIYSIIYLSLSRNDFRLAYDLLQMYHLKATGSKKQNLNQLINGLNSEFEFVKWRQAIES